MKYQVDAERENRLRYKEASEKRKGRVQNDAVT
jgi:hypothetical protein